MLISVITFNYNKKIKTNYQIVIPSNFGIK